MKLVEIGKHVLAWNIIIFFNYLYILGSELPFDIFVELSLLIIYIVVFYVGFFVLSKLFIKKKIFLFIISSVILLSSATALKQQQITYYRSQFRADNEDELKDLRKSLNFKFELEKRFENHIFNKRVLFNAYVILLFYLISIFFKVYQKWQYDEKQKIILLKEKTDAELLFLKQQINPHFLFNSLNSIYSLANKKSDKTTDAILKLSSILRYILYHSKKQLVSLEDEIKTIESYIELQELRITKKVFLTFDMVGEPGNYKIEPLLLMPLLENAFKYGVDSINESFIKISIIIIEDKFELKVSNTIVPNKKISKEESGIGLMNIKRRLELLYKESFDLDIFNDKNDFHIKLKLTLKE